MKPTRDEFGRNDSVREASFPVGCKGRALPDIRSKKEKKHRVLARPRARRQEPLSLTEERCCDDSRRRVQTGAWWETPTQESPPSCPVTAPATPRASRATDKIWAHLSLTTGAPYPVTLNMRLSFCGICPEPPP